MKYKKLNIKEIKTIDNEFKNYKKIDFIKCDTQGSEFDISLGAKRTLINSCPIVAMETWCENVYDNAPLDFEIRAFYQEIGFQLFATDIAAAWRYESNSHFPLSRQRIIGENLLYIPRLEMFEKLAKDQILSKIPILCFFGFYDYSYQILKKFDLMDYLPHVKNLYSDFANNYKFQNKLIRRIKGNKSIFPRIT